MKMGKHEWPEEKMMDFTNQHINVIYNQSLKVDFRQPKHIYLSL
jgi:hypothetical protein